MPLPSRWLKPLSRKASRVFWLTNTGLRSTRSKTSAGTPSWVAAMSRSTLARPRTFSTGAATERGSDPRAGGSPAAFATPR